MSESRTSSPSGIDFRAAEARLNEGRTPLDRAGDLTDVEAERLAAAYAATSAAGERLAAAKGELGKRFAKLARMGSSSSSKATLVAIGSWSVITTRPAEAREVLQEIAEGIPDVEAFQAEVDRLNRAEEAVNREVHAAAAARQRVARAAVIPQERKGGWLSRLVG